MSDSVQITNNPIESKVQYFIDYWRDLTHEDQSIESDLIHSILYNPKELIKEFIEEIERKQLSNSDNKKFFIDKMNEFARLDLNALKFILPTLKLIQQQFGKKDDFGYLLHLLKMAQLKLEDFNLGKEAVKELSELLTDESEIQQTKIKHLVNIIIFELMHKKLSRKKIIQIISDIFSNYSEHESGYIHTNFPHNIESGNWKTESEEYQEYKKQLIEYIDGLAYKDRILAIASYFDTRPEELRFVFQIKGLRGENINFNIGNVQIYNPKNIRLFQTPTEYFNELFEKEIIDQIYYCNGAVTLEVVDREYAAQEALQILENTLDIIASRYTYYKIPIAINTSKYYVIDSDGNNRGGSTTSTWEFLAYQDSIELDNSKYDSDIYAKQISKDKLLEIDKKIFESMHWKRKAIESNDGNEKILWHWVAMENLFQRKNHSTPMTIFESVSKLLAKRYLYQFAWKHFHKLSDITDTTAIMRHYRLEIKLPHLLKNAIGLNATEGEAIYLTNLIDNLDELQSNLDEKSLFYEQLEYLKKIFTDTKECIALLEKLEKIFFEKLVYVYRMRNKIVHNAHNESSPIAQYYVEFVAMSSAISINTFINIRGTLSLQTSDEIINNIAYEYDKFGLELKEQGTKVLL